MRRLFSNIVDCTVFYVATLLTQTVDTVASKNVVKDARKVPPCLKLKYRILIVKSGEVIDIVDYNYYYFNKSV